MTVSLNTNTSALTAQRNIADSSLRSSSSLAKLSSGSRVPTARDDVAALAVGTRLSVEVASLRQAQQNVGQGISLLQIADGALATTSDILTRQKSLAVQASSDQLNDADRALLNNEYQALAQEVDRIAADTAFNGTNLLSGTATAASNVNDLGAGNLIGEGFESVDFGNDFGNGAVSFAFDNASNTLTATNEGTGATQSVDIGAAAIGAGQTQTVNFNSLDVSVTLGDQFDKDTDIAAVNTQPAVDGTEITAGVIEAGSISLEGITVNASPTATTAEVLDAGRFADATVDITGAAGAATLSISAFNQDGSATTLEATGVDLTSTGTTAVTLSDANGNSIDVEFNITTAFAGTDTVAGDGSNSIELAELGQVVGANSVNSGQTSFTFTVGTGTSAEDVITADLTASDFTALAGESVGDVTTSANAAVESAKLDVAINSLTSNRATIGAAQSRLQFANSSIAVATENTLSAQSQILDVDVTQEITEFTSSQVLLQAGISLLSQANQQPSLLLGLLN